VTAVAAVRVNRVPVLVGDVVLSHEGYRIDFAGKVYRLSPNVVVGWSGTARVGREAIGRLRAALQGRPTTAGELEEAFDLLAPLWMGSGRLELIGWIATAGGAKVIRWATHYSPVLLSDAEGDIGDGGAELRGLLAPPAIEGGNLAGFEGAVLATVGRFIEARFEETLRPREWQQTWGVAYDLLALHDEPEEFCWLPSMTMAGHIAA
jgi:hypothetical protein